MATVQSSTSNKVNDVFSNLGLNKSNATDKTKSASAMEEAENRFMRLLVTQIKNQDPLNPMDNAQMTSQLAQINTVNGIEKLNASINKMVEYFQGGQAMEAAGMIGKHVLVPGSDLQLTTAGGIGGYELKAPADQVQVTIKDSNGLVMRTLQLGEADAGTGNFFWDGKTDGGVAAVPGNYSYLIEATRGKDSVGSSPLTVGTVNAVTRSSNGFELDLGELGDYQFDEIKQIL